MLNLKKLGDSIYHGINIFDGGQGWTSNSNTPINRARQSINNSNAQMQNARYGVLADQNRRNQFIQSQQQQPKFNPIAAGVRSIWDTDKKIAGMAGGLSGAPAFIDSARLGIAELTKNQNAIDATTTRLAKNVPQALPIASALAVKPFAQDLVSAAMSPVAEHYANQERDRAARMLRPSYGSNADVIAGNIHQDILTDPLRRAGHNTTDSTAKDVAVNAATAAATIGLMETPRLGGVLNKEVSLSPVVNKTKDLFRPGLLVDEAGSVPLGAKPKVALKPTQEALPLEQAPAPSKQTPPVVVSSPNSTADIAKAQTKLEKLQGKAYKERRNLTPQERVTEGKLMEQIHGTPPQKPVVAGKDGPYIPPEQLKDVRPIDRAWMTTKGVISRYGETGKDIANRLGLQRDNAEVGKAQFYESIPAVQGLKKDEFSQFAQALEARANGTAVQVTPRIEEAIGQWNAAITGVRERAVNSGLDVGDLGENYFPRFYKDLEKPGGYQKLINNIMAGAQAKGKPITMEDAIAQAQFIRESSIKKFGNLEKTRSVDAPGYEMNHDAIVSYIDGAFERITKAEQFGAKNEKLDAARAQLMRQGIDPSKVFDKKLDIALGNTDKTSAAHRASSGMRQFNAVTSLSAAGISNATQLTNTMTKAGIWRTAKGIYKIATDADARQAVREAGVTLDHSIKAISEQQLGVGNKITRNIASPFFATVEKFNREVTGTVGADYGNHLARRAAQGDAKALQELQDMGVKGKIGETLTPTQEIQAARKLVEISQFKVDPMDLPGWADSPLGKLAMQFRSFGYKQTGFMWNEVVRKALGGDFVPLARFIAVGAPAGMASKSARDLVRFKGYGQEGEEDTSPGAQQALGKIGAGLSQVGAFGLPGSTAQSLKSGVEYSNLPGAVVSTVGGPTAGIIAETYTNAEKAQKGNSDPLKKEAIRKIPMVGPSLSNIIMPGKKQAAAPKEGEKATPEYLNKKADEEKKVLEGRKTTDGSTLQQLSNGKYAFTLDGETGVQTRENLKDARKAIAEHSFKNSDENSKVIGDRYFYKDENGDTKSMPKYKHEFDVEDSQNQLDMTVAKDDENYGAWNESATKQIAALTKLRDKYNQDSQEDKVDDVQKKIETLKHQMEKYASYGGAFKKGGSGGGGGGGGGAGGNYGSTEKYAISVNSSGKFQGPKAKVSFASKTPSKSVSTSKPKVSIKKSRV